MRRLWDWIDDRAIIRRSLTIGTFIAVLITLRWSMGFAETSPRSGGDVALILGAVWGPLSALMGYTFGQYTASRKDM